MIKISPGFSMLALYKSHLVSPCLHCTNGLGLTLFLLSLERKICDCVNSGELCWASLMSNLVESTFKLSGVFSSNIVSLGPSANTPRLSSF